jgi:hypothetical protein
LKDAFYYEQDEATESEDELDQLLSAAKRSSESPEPKKIMTIKEVNKSVSAGIRMDLERVNHIESF